MVLSLRRRDLARATLVTGTQTASTTSTAETGFAGAQNVILQLSVTAVSGTAPNLIVVVEDSIDNTNWNPIATFTAVTGVTAEVKRVAGPFGNSVRARSTITGTAPSMTFLVVAQAEGDK